MGKKRTAYRILCALAAGSVALVGGQALAAPQLVSETITEDRTDAPREGIAASITGEAKHIALGTADGAGALHPIIGDPAAPGYFKYRTVHGTWAGSATRALLSAAGGGATIYSGTTGDVHGVTVSLKNGGEATAKNGTVNVYGGNITGSEYGGLFGALAEVNVTDPAANAAATAMSSTLHIYGGDVDTQSAGACAYVSSTTGGSTVKATASRSTVFLHAAADAGNVFGGYGYAFSTTGTDDVTAVTEDNTAVISAANFHNSVKGGYATATTHEGAVAAKANRNTVTINGGRIDEGMGGDSSAMTNGSTPSDKNSAAAEAVGNTVTMNGGTATTLWGASAMADTGNNIGAARAVGSDNRVVMNGGTVTNGAYFGMNGAWVNANIAGAAADGYAAATGNTVTITAGTVRNKIAGGRSTVSSWGEGKTLTAVADRNAVAVGDAVVGALRGGYAAAEVTNSGDTIARADGNMVTVAGGTVRGNIFGGVAAAQAVMGTSRASANDNVVNIDGGTITGTSVVGGAAAASDETEALGNIINISGTPTLAGVTLYGAAVPDGNGGIAAGSVTRAAGNTLNLYASGITAHDVKAFQAINFYIPAGADASVPMLRLTSADNTDLTQTALRAYVPGGVNPAGRILMQKDAGAFRTAPIEDITVSEGVSLTYGVELSSDARALRIRARSGGMRLNADTKAFAETRAGSTAFLNAGADLIADRVMTQSVQMKKDAGPNPFFVTSASRLRHETGSHVNVRGMQMGLGFAADRKTAHGRTVYGPLVTYGRGAYDSHLEGGTRGDGRAHDWSIGAYVRHLRTDGLYYEGSLRGGRIAADYRGDLAGTAVSYEDAAEYYAGHLGIGRETALRGRDCIDYYGKYFLTRLQGSSAKLSTGEIYDFDAVTSRRAVLGTRYRHAVGTAGTLRFDIAYQYEFDGDARASYRGLSTPTPSLRGSSVRCGIGWQTRTASGMTVEAGIDGWAGRQRGAAYSLTLSYPF